MNQLNPNEDNQYKEFTLPNDIEKYANPFEIWFLKLDKYIDAKYQPQIGRFGFRLGVVAALLFFILIKIVHFITHQDLAILMLGVALVNTWALMIQQKFWFKPRRIEQEIFKKQKYDCGCSRAGIPGYNQQFWISRRLLAHYMCSIYQIWSTSHMGWLVMTIPLLLGNWLIVWIIK